VQRAPGLPCALSFGGRNDLQNFGRNASREREGVSTVIASEAKQSMPPQRKNGLLRSARKDDFGYRNNINIIAPMLTTQCSLHQHSMALWL
jgi:hypothetical protein